MSRSDRSPQLPALPRSNRRRAAARQSATLALMLGGVQPAPAARPKAMASVGRYSHLGVAALCITAVGLVATLVTFSILRDQAALRRAPVPIVTPLHP